ncbi:MAG: ABC transporter substrate-binding protein [Verrucomicrobia bacterium]|nr:ABC transporter substrate-binding protein [Verrucomicrobiota bacterium]
MKLLLGHSPDADDAFMFYAMAKGLVNLRGHEYEHILQDIETLNRRCQKGELDVSAVSFHAFTTISDRYTLLPCGASFGDGYGPCLVAKKKYSREEMKKLRIAVPGLLTSAYLTLQLYLGLPHGSFQGVVVPFDRIQEEICAGKVEAGLLIHEGQLTYAEEGFTLCEDLGQWWAQETGGLPLPLGGNVVRRDLGADVITAVTETLRESVRYGLEHRQAGVRHALPLSRGMDEKRTDKFIGMYVNDLTLDLGPRGRAGLREFYQRAAGAGLISRRPEVG